MKHTPLSKPAEVQWRVFVRGVATDTPFGTSCSHEGTNLAIFDRNQSATAVFSALSNFDSVIQARLPSTFELRTGVLGSIRSIPAGHSFESMVQVSANGINAAYQAWGSALLKAHGKPRTSPNASVVLSHLGFSTTGDYFYTPEGIVRFWCCRHHGICTGLIGT